MLPASLADFNISCGRLRQRIIGLSIVSIVAMTLPLVVGIVIDYYYYYN